MVEIDPGGLFTVVDEEIVGLVFIPDRAQNFVGVLRALGEESKLPVVVGAPPGVSVESVADLAAKCVTCPSPTDLVNRFAETAKCHLLVVTDAVELPPTFLDPAIAVVRDELRVATVSFLCNDAAFLSFPDRNHPVERAPTSKDEVIVTRELRAGTPAEAPAPLPVAAGPAVLISSVALGVVGRLEPAPSGAFAASLADFCFRARERGFRDVLDPTTFVTRPSDISVDPPGPRAVSGLTEPDESWLERRHPTVHGIIAHEASKPDSALGLALGVARAKVVGLRVVIDGTCLGPNEMGTQVTTVALIDALAARDDVREVRVLLSGPVPAYARQLLGLAKVRFGPPREEETADILHRPFQPNLDFEVDRARPYADRVVVTVHDLIGFHAGTYLSDYGVWERYRESMRRALRAVDGVVVVSEDVRQQLQLERMPVPAERVFVVPNGTEHLRGDEAGRLPAELAARGFAAGEFLLCLGTNYTHKNRDLAMGVIEELRRRGHDIALVLSGPVVPWGSSRALEARAAPRDGVYVIPEVSSEERNWLVRHASLVLYPTSAEGFGLIPYEAARFGTPTVYVGFGPLREVVGNLPVVARDWRPEALADAAEALLTDPALARRQVASCLEAGATYTWSNTSEKLTRAYRSLLARPPAGPGLG